MNRLMISAAVAALSLSAACAGEKENTTASNEENDSYAQNEESATEDQSSTETKSEYSTGSNYSSSGETTAQTQTTAPPPADTLTGQPADPATAAPATLAEVPPPVTEDVVEDISLLYAELGEGIISAKELLGEEIYGPAGDGVAHVDDLLIGADNTVDKIVYVTGGVGGVGGVKSTIEYENATIAFADEDTDTSADATELASGNPEAMDDEEHDLTVSVAMTDDQLKEGEEFEQVGLNDYRLASELLGAEIELVEAGEDETAVVNDLILTEDGTVSKVIIQRDAIAGIGTGDRYAFNFAMVGVEQGDGGLVLNATASEIEAAMKLSQDIDTDLDMDSDMDDDAVKDDDMN